MKSVNPILVESMRRNFHYRIFTTLINHFGKEFKQFVRSRCSIMRLNGSFSYHILNCADKTHFISCIFQNRFKHICYRCFSVCSCYTYNMNFFGRIIKPYFAHIGKGIMRIFANNLIFKT